MNRNNRESALHRAKAAAHSLKTKIGAGSLIAFSALPAFAQSGPDVSGIEAELDTYKTAVIALVISFAVVLWAIKAAGLLKPRG